MKLIRHGAFNREQPGLLIDNQYFDATAFGEDYNERFFETDGLARLQAFYNQHKNQLPLLPQGVRLGSPVARPSKIIGVGLNYMVHAAESGFTPPSEPVLFMKASTSLCGPYDQVIIPPGAGEVDWEVELAVVIGKTARYVAESDAMQHVAGYAVLNDISERNFQMGRPGGQWDKGKGCDTFAPMGPFMATTDEIPNPHNLDIWLRVNGQQMQHSNTRDLIFTIPVLIAHISKYMTLLPGDIISTGTPGGVGFGMKPPLYLKPGDVMELGVEGLGVARQQCVAY